MTLLLINQKESVSMSASYNMSPSLASAVVAILAKDLVPFSTAIVDGPTPNRRIDVIVDDAYKNQLDKAKHLVDNANAKNITVTTNTDSEEQSSCYMNGTLSNVSPGLAITVQVSPSSSREDMTEDEAKDTFPAMFLPLAAQGWSISLILGDDIDNPTE